MSSSSHVGKKAVHVKWAGKTIALGTFPTAEADDKCARAKALTRAWRSTMRPKPSREWVMLELERLNVRVVSGRVAQKESHSSDSEGGDDDNPAVPSRVLSNISGNNITNNNSNTQVATTLTNTQQQQQQQLAAAGVLTSADQNLLNLDHHRRNSITASLLNVADLARGGDRRNSLASLDSSFFINRQGSLSLAPNLNLNVNASIGGDNTAGEKRDAPAPAVRPYVGGGSAAAYEATREDHYRKIAERRKLQKKDGGGGSGGGNHAANNLAGGRASSGGTTVGSLANDVESFGALNQIGAGIGGMNQQISTPASTMNLPSNANQHYEMLKLHHMNLLNEIQETNLMMNLYQQQQLQQQLQQDQLNNNRYVDPQLSLLSQQQQLLAGASGLSQAGRGLGQASAGLGLGQAGAGVGVGQGNVGLGLGLGQGNAGLCLGQANAGLGLGQTSAGSLGLGSLIGQQNSLSQVGGLAANDLGIPHRRSSSGNDSGSSNNNSMINNGIADSISNGINKGINNISSNTAANSDSNPTLSPSRKHSSSVSNTNGNGKSKSKRKEIDEASAANAAAALAHDDQLQRIKDEIAERQRMVDELERNEPKQKRSKLNEEM